MRLGHCLSPSAKSEMGALLVISNPTWNRASGATRLGGNAKPPARNSSRRLESAKAGGDSPRQKREDVTRVRSHHPHLGPTPSVWDFGAASPRIGRPVGPNPFPAGGR